MIEINNEHLVVKALEQLSSKEWINQYYDLVKRILIDLGIQSTDVRASFTCTKEMKLNFIIGGRYIIRPVQNERIICIVPFDFKLTSKEQVDKAWWFEPEDIKGVELPFPLGGFIPEDIYQALISCS